MVALSVVKNDLNFHKIYFFILVPLSLAYQCNVIVIMIGRYHLMSNLEPSRL